MQGATGASSQHDKPGPLPTKPSSLASAVHGHDVQNKSDEGRKREAKETIQDGADLTSHPGQPIQDEKFPNEHSRGEAYSKPEGGQDERWDKIDHFIPLTPAQSQIPQLCRPSNQRGEHR